MADYGKIKVNTVTYKNGSDADTDFNFKTDIVSKDTDNTFTGTITLDNDKEVRFSEADSNGSAYIGLKAPTDLGSVSSYTLTLPTTAAATNKVLKTDGSTATQLVWGDDTNANTTYTVSCVDGDNSDEEKIRLTGSDSATDDVVLEAGTGLSIARSGDKITFTNTVSDTNTTYTAGDGLALSSTEFTLDLAKDQTWVGSQRGAIETEALSGSGDTRTLTLDFATGNYFYVDLVGSVTTVALSNATAGQSGSIIIKQSVGSKTIAGWNGAFDWGTKTAPTITATQNKFDRIDYFIYSATQIHVIHSGGYDG